MRLPALMLESTVVIERLAPATSRGSTFEAPITRRAHVEETQRLVVDTRPDAPTGAEVVAQRMIMTQLADYAAPGSMITVAGERRQVVAASRYTHTQAPEHAEHWTI